MGMKLNEKKKIRSMTHEQFPAFFFFFSPGYCFVNIAMEE